MVVDLHSHVGQYGSVTRPMRRSEIEDLAASIRALLADPDAGINEPPRRWVGPRDAPVSCWTPDLGTPGKAAERWARGWKLPSCGVWLHRTPFQKVCCYSRDANRRGLEVCLIGVNLHEARRADCPKVLDSAPLPAESQSPQDSHPRPVRALNDLLEHHPLAAA